MDLVYTLGMHLVIQKVCFTRATACYNNNSYKYSAAMGLQCEKRSGDCHVSLMPSLLAPPGEKRSGE